jgi:hypothetical protein
LDSDPHQSEKSDPDLHQSKSSLCFTENTNYLSSANRNVAFKLTTYYTTLKFCPLKPQKIDALGGVYYIFLIKSMGDTLATEYSDLMEKKEK